MHGTLNQLPAAVPAIVAEVTTHDQLIQALRCRVVEVNTTFAGVDLLAGLPENYAAKLLAGAPIKGLSVFTLMCLINALALKLRLDPDDKVLAKLKRRPDWVCLPR